LLLMSFLTAIPFGAAQESAIQVELNPSAPTADDVLTFKLSGIWRDGCVPQSPVVSIISGLVRIQTSNSAAFCVQALTPWTLDGSAGKLTAGDYLLVVEYSGANVPSPVEIGRKALTISSSSAANEVVLPIVVNGAFAEKLHYQTIFTILNASRQQVQTSLQVYSNQGKPGGVFCAPIAPPPSSATSLLVPGAESVQFTSADLPYLDGWALLRWEGSASLLAAEELTLVAAAPQACLLVCNRPSTEKLSSTQIPAIKPAKEFRLPVTFNLYRQTALAIINPSAVETATVRISLLDLSGKNANLGVPDSFEIRIPPLQRVSKFLWQLARESSALTVVIPAPESFQGSVILASNIPIAVGALHIMFPQGKFVAIPSFSPFP
jgi:hypothetical protein